MGQPLFIKCLITLVIRGKAIYLPLLWYSPKRSQVRFLVSYPQTTWECHHYRMKSLAEGRLYGSNQVQDLNPGGRIDLYETQDQIGDLEKLGELITEQPYGIEYVAGEGLY